MDRDELRRALAPFLRKHALREDCAGEIDAFADRKARLGTRRKGCLCHAEADEAVLWTSERWEVVDDGGAVTDTEELRLWYVAEGEGLTMENGRLTDGSPFPETTEALVSFFCRDPFGLSGVYWITYRRWRELLFYE